MLVIQQLHYGATSRYNFPPDVEELDLPEKLVEVSLGSMLKVKGRYLQPYEVESALPFPEKSTTDELVDLPVKSFSTLLTPLKPIQDGTPIIGIDVSSIRIGETESGIICAVRGAVVWNEKKCYKFLRIGPFPFHITEENKTRIFSELGQNPSSGLSLGISTPNETQRKLCNLVEKRVQTSISGTASKSIILWDGSLTAGVPGNPVNTVSQSLALARRNLNSVLAFSKSTTLRFLGWRITEIVSSHEPPCLLEIEDLPLSVSKTIHLLGKIYTVKLTPNGCSFRLDIDRSLRQEQAIVAVERLLGNEILFQGYPETLRLAHIYSTFTANDVLGIQSFLALEYGLKLIARHNIRRTLFGPYATGIED